MNREVMLNFCKNPQNKIDFGAYRFNKICNEIKGCTNACLPCGEICDLPCDGVYKRIIVPPIENSSWMYNLFNYNEFIGFGLESFIVNGTELLSEPYIYTTNIENANIEFYGNQPVIHNLADFLNGIHPDFNFGMYNIYYMFIEFPSCYTFTFKTKGILHEGPNGSAPTTDIRLYDELGFSGLFVLGNEYGSAGLILGNSGEYYFNKCKTDYIEEDIPCQNGPINIAYSNYNSGNKKIYSFRFVNYDTITLQPIIYNSPTDTISLEYSTDGGNTYVEFDDDLSYYSQVFEFPVDNCTNTPSIIDYSLYNLPDVRLIWKNLYTHASYGTAILKILPDTFNLNVSITDITVDWGDGSLIQNFTINGVTQLEHNFPDGEFITKLTINNNNSQITSSLVEFLVRVNLNSNDKKSYSYWSDFTNGINNQKPKILLCSNNLLYKRLLSSNNIGTGTVMSNYNPDRVSLITSTTITPNLQNITTGDRVLTETVNTISNIDFITPISYTTTANFKILLIDPFPQGVYIRCNMNFKDNCPPLFYEQKVL